MRVPLTLAPRPLTPVLDSLASLLPHTTLYQQDKSLAAFWQIETPENSYIGLTFTDFEFQPISTSCSEGSVKITEVERPGVDESLIGEYCGHNPDYIESNLNRVKIEFDVSKNVNVSMLLEYEAAYFGGTDEGTF